MAFRSVLARASRGEPLIRVVVGHGDSVVYLANPTRVAAVEAGRSFPVGFPIEDVFELDEQLAQRLTDQWRDEGRTTNDAWREARPYI